MEIQSAKPKSALVLPGGGARGAFQVGVMMAIAEMVPRGTANPFAIISGTSAGAINSVVLASKARRFRVAVAELGAGRVVGGLAGPIANSLPRDTNSAVSGVRFSLLGPFASGASASAPEPDALDGDTM